MKVLVVAALVIAAAGANARASASQYPSCDLKALHAIKGDIGGSITDLAGPYLPARQYTRSEPEHRPKGATSDPGGGRPMLTTSVRRGGAQGPIRSVYVRDPDGNLIAVSSYD
ncbi:hypothetical protein [Sphingomonas sp. 22176]|uniref:hypothetical protein n=1 Tax=Sphingomonas sp. 22176 TaxID=3453884 RepID=UPI003F8474F3